MERYLGLDVHAASCTLAVVSQNGKRLRDLPVETNGQALVEAIRMIPGRKRLVYEEGLQSAWLYDPVTIPNAPRPSPLGDGRSAVPGIHKSPISAASPPLEFLGVAAGESNFREHFQAYPDLLLPEDQTQGPSPDRLRRESSR
jgi:hypothetical protein